MKKLSIFGFLAILFMAKLSFACGGLFCNNAQPVNQVAERILFAKDGSNQYQMHVQIQYEGPPQGFSWMLPVPRNTEFALSTPSIFSALDAQFAPIFSTVAISNREGCDNRSFPSSVNDSFGGQSTGNPEENGGVQVLSREKVGPYEKVSLNAESVTDLITWLTENNYQVPPRSEEVLSPYIGNYDFIAIKLLEGKDAGDIRPVALSFSSPTPAIPLRPTSVAANPDMGIIVNILADMKAIPSNYSLVEINEATIDWINNGSNYADVVSQAIDESPNGQGFTTDFAGLHNNNIFINNINESQITGLEEVRTLGDLIDQSVGQGYPNFIDLWMSFDVELSKIFDSEYEKLNAAQSFTDIYYQCYQYDYNINAVQFQDTEECNAFKEYALDGAALKERILSEYIDVNQNVIRLVGQNPYLTRLYTTLSADEMTVDPVFSFNMDMQTDVSRNRSADLIYDCDTNENLYIRLSNGIEINLVDGQNPATIVRQNGETVRGQDQVGASLISRPLESGQPEVIQNNEEVISNQFPSKNGIASANEDSGCQSMGQNSLIYVLFSLILVYGLRRRELNA